MAETTKHDPEQPHGHSHGEGHENPMVSHERRDVNIFQITAFGIGLLISCLVVVFLMWGMFAFLAHREDQANAPVPHAMANERARQLPPEPRLSGFAIDDKGARSEKSVYPHVELGELREDESAILDSYGVLDPNKGIARIPIDKAIDIVAQKGLPSKPSPAGENGGFRMIPSNASSGRTLEKISQ